LVKDLGEELAASAAPKVWPDALAGVSSDPRRPAIRNLPVG
jgi:hypothetical protein